VAIGSYLECASIASLEIWPEISKNRHFVGIINQMSAKDAAV
jgi:hypothetical protein